MVRARVSSNEIYVCVFVWERVCVCVCQRKRERQEVRSCPLVTNNMLCFDFEALRLRLDGAAAISASGAFWAGRAALAVITRVTYHTTSKAT